MNTPKKAKPLKERIREHYRPGIHNRSLMHLCFPRDEYPNSWKMPMQGGPPGCSMSFGRAIREMGGTRDASDIVWIPSSYRNDSS